jgi:WD40 repeat protein
MRFSLNRQQRVWLFFVAIIALIAMTFAFSLYSPRGLRMTLRGHTDWIRCVAFSPDGKVLITGSKDRTARLWNTATGECTAILTGHSGEVLSAAFANGGKQVATAGSDGRIKIWDVSNGREQVTLSEVRPSSFFAIAFQPDSQILASGGEKGSVSLWDISTGKIVAVLKGHNASIRSITITNDGKSLVSRSEDGVIIVWSIKEQIEKRRIGNPENILFFVYRATLSPNGSIIARNNYSGTVSLLDIATGANRLTLNANTPWPIYSLAFSPDSRFMAASVMMDKNVYFWDASTGHLLCSRRVGTSLAIAIDPGGSMLATGGTDTNLRIWSFDALLN